MGSPRAAAEAAAATRADRPISTSCGVTSISSSAALFGRRGGGTPGGGGPPTSGFGGGAGLLAVLVVVVWLASGFYIVDASQRGVVLRLRELPQTTEPGLRWQIPYPFQSHEVVNLTQVRTIEVGYRNDLKSKCCANR